jgi:hypothetical protein
VTQYTREGHGGKVGTYEEEEVGEVAVRLSIGCSHSESSFFYCDVGGGGRRKRKRVVST